MTAAALEDRIAIVGMACRVPGAADLEAFWRNLVAGVESIETLSEEELRAAGVPESLLQDPRYVRAGGFISDTESFDGALFGLTPREAAMLDPQHRLLMECAWHALEHAGHAGGEPRLRVGVYTGVANSAYYHANVRPSLDPRDTASAYQALIGGERDFLATRLAYFFDLSGPGVNVQTACSTSLVATHLACQALLAGECDMALAGGAALRQPQRVGYLYEEGMILSRDGHCRAFDAEASGTVIGNGAGMVVLRRLDDALADGDTVHAVILASAVNNDGARKAGYTAPGIEGQASVVREAQSLAGIDAGSIGYVEAHGTGTPLGDPIEVAALGEAFRRSTKARGFCALGSVKSNVGHLDIAAGVVGLIKAALSVSRGVIPPSLHFRRPNPALSLEKTPFFVPQSARDWRDETRRAAVSSFGIGGTNAHVVLESPVARPPSCARRRWHVVCTSGRTALAHRSVANALAGYLAQKDAAPLADVAFTSCAGRRALAWRRALVCDDAARAAGMLRREPVAEEALPQRRVAFVFTDGDDAAATQALAASEPVFRGALAEARGALRVAGVDSTAAARVFGFQYALAALFRAFGVAPHAVMGFGVGEYAAAVAAGALTLAQALKLFAARGDVQRLRAAIGDLTLRGPSVQWIAAGGERYGKAAAIELAALEALGTRPRNPIALRALLEERDLTVLELGPGATIAPWVQSASGPSTVVASACDAEAEDAAHAIAKALARLWSCGASVDWSAFHADESRRRVPLPLYPFERVRCWIEPGAAAPAPAAAVARDVVSELRAYRATWMRAPRLALPASIGGEWLVVGDAEGLAPSLAARITAAGAEVTLAPEIGPACDDFLGRAREPRIVLFDATYEATVALGHRIVAHRARAALIAVTRNVHAVTGNDGSNSRGALVLGPVRVLPQEYPEIACRHVDLDAAADDGLPARLAAECAAADAPTVVALRGEHRWCPATEPMALATAPAPARPPVYLIVGGAGMMGLALARHLHETERASLVLVGRASLPPPEAWRAQADEAVTFDIDAPPPDEGLGDKLAALAALQADGAQLLYVAADASDAAALRAAFDQAEARFGRVDVVVHAAAAPVAQTATAFERLDAAAGARHFVPKVEALEALRAIVREKRPRACALMSSLSSVLGGLGFTAYAAANACLDAVAQHADGADGVRWLSLGWDAWRSPDATRAANAGTISRAMIEPGAGVDFFRRALASPGAAHILAAAGALETRLARSTHDATHTSVDATSTTAPMALAGVDTAQLIASTWRELLGVATVGPDDDFYDLGGNSLLATQVVSRLRRALGIELPVRVLFEQTTVAGLARHIDALPSRPNAKVTSP